MVAETVVLLVVEKYATSGMPHEPADVLNVLDTLYNCSGEDAQMHLTTHS